MKKRTNILQNISGSSSGATITVLDSTAEYCVSYDRTVQIYESSVGPREQLVELSWPHLLLLSSRFGVIQFLLKFDAKRRWLWCKLIILYEEMWYRSDQLVFSYLLQLLMLPIKSCRQVRSALRPFHQTCKIYSRLVKVFDYKYLRERNSFIY